MPESANPNPLRVDLVNRAVPAPCVIVIFGATGDLTRRKLIPALYNLAADGNLPSSLAVVCFARRDKTSEDFREELGEAARKYSRRPVNEELWARFAANIFYHRSSFDNPEGYTSLGRELDAIDARLGTGGNRLFYLASSPTEFDVILENLRASGLSHANAGAWSRLIVEKPFGTDLPSAERLNSAVAAAFPERETFRIDHYLGKETAQNIMVLRFANTVFEALWNRRYVESVQITASEPLGVESRAGYYENAGALRDMVQNHLLQLLCLTAMEPPIDLGADAVRNEKVKVMQALRPLTGKAVAENVVRAQYTAGYINGKEVPGYREEPGVAPGSMTETYVALRLHIDNWRWAGVPFFMRVGKRLPKSGTEIAIRFRGTPPVLFNRESQLKDPNVLVIRIQPDEGISFRMAAKMPGAILQLEPVKMDFHYGTSFGKATPEAYERLLLDAMSGDATLFARRDEVEHAWTFIDGIRKAWSDGEAPRLDFYPAGSWGPHEADELLAQDDAVWRRL
ncbi:MAG: glucose-6-phosphate dehydrogenase [Chthoniobacterales bacterium]|nr:glucose-6-phosphate dehydrogenase [Chthoniobacterales bacterium]